MSAARTYVMITVLALAAGAAFSWWITSTSYRADIALADKSHADDRAQWEADKAAISKQAQRDTEAALNRTKAANEALAAIDQKHTQELADAKLKNDRLSADVAAGNRRVRILKDNLSTAELAARQHTAGGNTGSASLGDGADAILSATAGSLVLDIRGGIIEKEKQLETLQDYVEKVVRQCKR